MFLEEKGVLHIVDTAARFSAATFLDSNGSYFGQSVQGICPAFVVMRCLAYTGYPNQLRTDQRSTFSFGRRKHLTDLNGIQLHLSGIEAHSPLGIGERYCEPLRLIYRKIRFMHSTIEPHYVLKIAI